MSVCVGVIIGYIDLLHLKSIDSFYMIICNAWVQYVVVYACAVQRNMNFVASFMRTSLINLIKTKRFDQTFDSTI